MSKSLLKIKARELRNEGVGVREIAKLLGISKGTVSLWVRDIILTIEQLETLRNSYIQGSERGRLKGALTQKNRRLELIEDYNQLGIKEIDQITKREFMLAGLTLYWGEGSKKDRRVEFCNSDPLMIKFYINWLITCFGVKLSDLKCTVGINEIHIERENVVREYWSEYLSIPEEQFRKTSFKKVENKKIYANFNEHYGTLTVLVVKSSQLYYKIMGLLKGLSLAA